MFLNHYHLFVCIKQNLEDQNISDNLPFSFSKFVYWPIFWKHDFYPINRFSMESKECLDKGILFHLSYFWTAINFAGCRFNQNLILRANEFTTKKFLLSWRKNFVVDITQAIYFHASINQDTSFDLQRCCIFQKFYN